MKQDERGLGAAFEVTSVFPGRIRLRFADPDAPLDKLTARLRGLPGVADVTTPPGTRSLVVRYAPREGDLEEMVGDVEGAVASVLERAEAKGHGRQAGSRNGRPPAPRNGTVPSIDGLILLHQMPGRVRLRVPGLRRRSDVAARLEHDVSTRTGIRDVEVQARSEFVIVRYDPDKVGPNDISKLVSKLFQRACTRPLPDDEFHRAADLKPNEPPKVNPLLLPTVAYGLAALEAAPVVVGGALALATLPIVLRASQSLRRACLATEQFDVVTLALLASQGNFVAGSVMAWLIALSDLTRRNAREEARRAVSVWHAGQRQGTGAEVAGILENAPVSNTHVHTDAMQGAGRLAAPLLGMAVTDYLINRDPSRVIGILKPRCEFESGLQFVVPTTALTAITAAAENGVLFTNAKALERLAQADAVVMAVSESRDATLRGDLRGRGLEVLDADDRGELIERLQSRNRRVVLVTDRAGGLSDGPRADVTIVLLRSGAAIEEDTDVLIAGGDASLVVYAVDAARRAAASARHNVRLLSGAGVANVAMTLFNVSPAPISTLINTGATVTAAMNALRTKPVPGAASGRGAPRMALEPAS